MKDESLHGTTCLVFIIGITLLFAPCVSSASKLSSAKNASPEEQFFRLKATSVFKVTASRQFTVSRAMASIR